jgi:hypothetical protein
MHQLPPAIAGLCNRFCYLSTRQCSVSKSMQRPRFLRVSEIASLLWCANMFSQSGQHMCMRFKLEFCGGLLSKCVVPKLVFISNCSSNHVCSAGSCAKGVAWADKASAANTAHSQMECSNQGTCDRTTGLCACTQGFTGRACERSELLLWVLRSHLC